MISASGVVAGDANGNQMFQVISGPDFGKGLDSLFFEAYPLSADQFAVPVTVSSFTLE